MSFPPQTKITVRTKTHAFSITRRQILSKLQNTCSYKNKHENPMEFSPSSWVTRAAPGKSHRREKEELAAGLIGSKIITIKGRFTIKVKTKKK